MPYQQDQSIESGALQNLSELSYICQDILDKASVSLYPPEVVSNTAHETRVSALYDESTQLVFHIIQDNKFGQKSETTIIWRSPEDEKASVPDGIIKVTGSVLKVESEYMPTLYKPEFYATIQAPTLLKKNKNRISGDHVASVLTALKSAEPYDGQLKRDVIMLKAWNTLNDKKETILNKLAVAEDLRQFALSGAIDIEDLITIFGEPIKKLMSWQSRVKLYLEMMPAYIGLAVTQAAKESLSNSDDESHGH